LYTKTMLSDWAMASIDEFGENTMSVTV